MFTIPLKTIDPKLKLVKPDPVRDAPLAVEWLASPHGRETLRMMGVADAHNKPTTYETEYDRTQDFLSNIDQLNWMMEYDGKIVGTIWVDLTGENSTPTPAMDIMIGDLGARGKGLGSKSIDAVTSFLADEGFEEVHARHLVANAASKHMLDKLGYAYIGDEYTDKDTLVWQNRILKIVE